MKLIFLDFDGVLATDKTYRESGWREGDCPDISVLLCERRTKMLADYCACRPDVRIVISSSWRLGNTLDTLRDMLEKRGLPRELVIDRTPNSISGYRGEEIETYLRGIGDPETLKADIAILDDDNDLKPFKSRWIRTTFIHGLSEKHIRCMDRLLYPERKEK